MRSTMRHDSFAIAEEDVPPRAVWHRPVVKARDGFSNAGGESVPDVNRPTWSPA